jgi:DeoR/GlpR family transcriptional regulator of sugar metabolism
MLKSERIKKIREIIFDRKQINVVTLSALLDVTEVTIRSDLEQLEKEGFILRTFGGAVLNEEYTNQHVINDALSGRNIGYNKDKEYIAKIASKLVNENELIFLGTGVTCYYIAKELNSRKNIHVLTNNLYVINILSSNPYNNVIASGGMLSYSNSCMYGDFFNQNVENMFFSKAFFSVDGVDFNAGYTISNLIELNIFRTISQKSSELILAIDQTKFNKISSLRVGDLQCAKTVISNEKIPNEYKAYYFDNGIRIFTSYELNP